MKTLYIALFALALLALAPAVYGQQNSAVEGTFVGGNPSNGAYITNSFVLTKVPDRVYSVFGYNQTNVAICVQFFHTNAVPENGATPLFVVPAAANSNYRIDFATGLGIDSGIVVASTTTNTLTLAPTACITILAIESTR